MCKFLRTGIVGNTGSSVEELVDAVATVTAYNGEVLSLSVLLNDVANFSVLFAWFHYTSQKLLANFFQFCTRILPISMDFLKHSQVLVTNFLAFSLTLPMKKVSLRSPWKSRWYTVTSTANFSIKKRVF